MALVMYGFPAAMTVHRMKGLTGSLTTGFTITVAGSWWKDTGDKAGFYNLN
jgi:hypothetical protein